MVDVKLGEWLREAWEIIKDDWLTFCVAWLLASLIGTFTCGVLSGAMFIGFFMLCFKRLRGQPVEINDVFQGFGQWLTGLGIALLMVAALLPFFLLRFALEFGTRYLAEQDPDLAVVAVIGMFAGMGFQAIGNILIATIWFFAYQRAADQPNIGSIDAVRD